MYQHDMKKKQLETLLDEVVTECVSFVGVDLNTASQCLLRYLTCKGSLLNFLFNFLENDIISKAGNNMDLNM